MGVGMALFVRLSKSWEGDIQFIEIPLAVRHVMALPDILSVAFHIRCLLD